MKFICPCGQYQVEIDYDLLMQRYCEHHKCPKCGTYLVKFKDRLGVTYCSKYLANIQEMRDEERRRKVKPKSRSTNGNKRGRKWNAPKINRPNSVIGDYPDPSEWPGG